MCDINQAGGYKEPQVLRPREEEELKRETDREQPEGEEKPSTQAVKEAEICSVPGTL